MIPSTLTCLVLLMSGMTCQTDVVFESMFFPIMGNTRYALSFDSAGCGEIRNDRIQVVLEEKAGRRIRVLNQDLAMSSVGDASAKEDEPAALMSVVIDNSGSIDDLGLARMEAALAGFIQQMPDGVSVQLIRFSGEIQSKSAFLTDRKELIRLLHVREQQSGTALYDAVDVALNELQYAPAAAPLKFLMVITDGRDNESGRFDGIKNFESEVLRRTALHRIRMCVIGVTDDVDHDLLKRLAGGGYQAVSNFNGLDQAVNQVLEAVKRVRLIRLPAVSSPDRLAAVRLLQNEDNGGDRVIRELIMDE